MTSDIAQYSPVCKYGRMTEYGCGWVEQENFRGFYCDPVCGQTMAATFLRVNRDNGDLSTPGDSGGPWFKGNWAVGIMHGYTGGAALSEGVYMPIAYLGDKGLTVLVCTDTRRTDC